MRRLSWILASTAFVGLTAASGAAHARDRAEPADDSAVAQEVKDDQTFQPAAKEDETIIVTGSRISNPNVTAPSPVLAATQDQLLRQAPSNVADALNQLPIFRGSNSAATVSTGASPTQGNYLNLRNLGTNRTLILYDGIRVLPTNATGGVDANILPQLLIKRVDVVTGGASAAYGSDAVAGVVNFVTDKKFEGVKAIGQTGISDYGDAGSYRFGLAAGTSLADGRLHIEGSYERFHSNKVSAADRPGYDSFYSFVGGGSETNPFALITGAEFNTVTAGGVIRGGPLNGTVFLGGDDVKQFEGTPTATSVISTNSDGLPWRAPGALAGLTTDQAFGRIEYELTPRINVHAQGTWAKSRNPYTTVSDYRFPGSGAQLRLYSGNPFLPASVQDAMTAQNIESVVVGRASLEIPPFRVDVTNETMIASAGLDGTFDIGDTEAGWDVTYVRSRSTSRNRGMDSRNVNFFAAVDAVRDSSGELVCRVTITNPDLLPGCVPANIVGAGSLSPEAVNFIQDETFWEIENKMDIVAANLRFDPFDLPGGPVSIALGAEPRWQSLLQTSNSDPAIDLVAAYPGVRGVTSSTTVFRTTIAGVAEGSVDVKEAYGEIALPLLRDIPGIHSLDLNGAIRVTDYSTSGTVTTWKVGAVYEPVSDLRLRGTLSRDIAAPTLFQLFSGAQVVTGNILDPHIEPNGLAVQANRITRGNPDLAPEVATTWVVGGVYTPSWLPGFNISADYYDIKVEGAITVLGDAEILSDCEDSQGTAPVCDLIERPLPFDNRTPANAATAVNRAPLNLSSLRQRGLDIEANYRFPVGSDARVELRGNVNLLFESSTQQTVDAPILDAAGRGYDNQRVRANFSQAYFSGGFSLQLTERYIGPSELTLPRATELVFADPEVTRYNPALYVDLNVAQKIGRNQALEVFLNVENLFDKKPPVNGPTFTNFPVTTNPGLFLPYGSQYDIVGRYFTAGVRVNF